MPPRRRVILNCLNCNKEYEVVNYRAKESKYCCTKCAYEHFRKKSLPERTRNCEWCGKEFYNVVERVKFCSHECYGLSKRKREKRICENCGKEFEVKKSLKSVCCSLKCKYERMSEILSTGQVPKWKYKSAEWRKIRRQILYRDDFRCQKCFRDDKVLQIHHLDPLPEGSDDPKNLITLCVSCHKKTHWELANN